MDSLVMCGGEGSRLGFDGEKPLYEIDGIPMIDRVIGALRDSAVDAVYAVGSPAVPETASYVDVTYIEAGGEGYVADLHAAMDHVDPPVLSVAADLPLLDGEAIDWVLEGYTDGSTTICVPVGRKQSLGVSFERTKQYDGTRVVPSGVNVVGEQRPERIRMTEDIRFAVNVNRTRDAWVAEVFA